MSLEGNATAGKLLRGKINPLDVIYTDAYKIAVANGFEGTIDEWLASLVGPKGDKGDNGKDGKDGKTLATTATVSNGVLFVSQQEE